LCAGARGTLTCQAEDYAHSIIGCLIHDIGYVRGLFKAEDG